MRIVRQEPSRFGIVRSRWRLADLARVVPAFRGYTVSGVSKALRRLGVRLKRGRLRLHSPDPVYAHKVARIAWFRALAQSWPARVSLVYGDEMSIYRQPTLAPVYAPLGEEPTVPLSQRANTRYRVCAGLDAVTGRVVWKGGSKIGVHALCAWLKLLREAYAGRVLLLVWDNWPVHHHPDVLATAEALHIRLVWLPTYAPWENPIEKLWRRLKQQRLHCHHLAERWDELKTAVGGELDRYAHGSRPLLHYVGLAPTLPK